MTVSCAPTASRSFGCNTEWKDGSLLKTGAYLHSCTLCTKKSSESQNSCTLNIACNVTNSLRRQIIMSSAPAQYTLLHPRTPAPIRHLNITNSTSRYSLTLNESSNHYQRNAGGTRCCTLRAKNESKLHKLKHTLDISLQCHGVDAHQIITHSMRWERQRERERAKGRESEREREWKGERATGRESDRERERKGERARVRAHSYVWHEVSCLTVTNTMQARYTLLHPPHQMLGPPSQISEDAVIFANFNQLFKVDPETAHLW